MTASPGAGRDVRRPGSAVVAGHTALRSSSLRHEGQMEPAAPQSELRTLSRAELDTIVDWAAAEGWNPGLEDAEAYWAADPEGFAGVERQGELIASGSMVSYDGAYGFIGFFIVRPELRGQGIGRRIWKELCDRMTARLRPGAAIGIDGVFEMQDFYAATGFELSHRNLRMQGVGASGDAGDALVALRELPFGDLVTFDRFHFGVDRPSFLRRWVDPVGGLGLGEVADGRIHGIGVARRCREGYKIGPLFADDAECADRILAGLARVTEGEPIFLDVPELNPSAVALAERHGMHEVFGCARMYAGAPPPVPWDRIYGVTTFELG